MRCDHPHIVLSALTASNRPDAFIARWYNSSKEPQSAALSIPLARRVRAVNLLGSPTRVAVRQQASDRWRIQLRPFEILTLQIRTR